MERWFYIYAFAYCDVDEQFGDNVLLFSLMQTPYHGLYETALLIDIIQHISMVYIGLTNEVAIWRAGNARIRPRVLFVPDTQKTAIKFMQAEF